MKKSAIFACSMILLSASLALAEEKPKASSDKGAAKAHAALDKNKDGKITREESRAAADARFERLDTNKDGVVDAKDDKSRSARSHGKHPRGARGGTMKRFFEKADKNQDGKLSASEADTFHKERFQKLDANKDGFLTKDELKHKKPAAK